METTSYYQDRLKSFKGSDSSAVKVKWAHKVPSMAGMARGFYTFCPASGVKDQVECAECHAQLSNWLRFRGNPIEKHAGIASTGGLPCFVAALGDLSQALSRGLCVDFAYLAETCLASFKNGGLHDISRLLASQGFIDMPFDDKRQDTVGCVGCLCFPQNARDKPQHSRKCPIPEILERADPECVSAFLHRTATSETGGSELSTQSVVRPQDTTRSPGVRAQSLSRASDMLCAQGGLSDATSSAMPGVPAPSMISAVAGESTAQEPAHRESAPNVSAAPGFHAAPPLGTHAHETMQACSQVSPLIPAEIELSTDFRSVEACKATIGVLLQAFQNQAHESCETATLKCAALFDGAKSEICSEIRAQAIQYESGRIDLYTALTRVEDRIIRAIEKSHAQRINLIYYETDRVIQKLISESV